VESTGSCLHLKDSSHQLHEVKVRIMFAASVERCLELYLASNGSQRVKGVRGVATTYSTCLRRTKLKTNKKINMNDNLAEETAGYCDAVYERDS
jgi:hypothetical protein